MTVRVATSARRRLAGVLLACLVFAGVATTALSTVLAAASAPNILNYQGRLLNANGVPVSAATASISFSLYTAVSGGTCLWSNSSATCASQTARTVTLTDGLFSEDLGDTAASTPYPALADSVFSDNAALFLSVVVEGETLAPRKQIVAAPYAMNSDTLDGYTSTLTGGTSAAVLVLDATGNLQLTGSPQGIAVGQGSVYINPAAVDLAANEVVFGIAVGAAQRFTVDGEGDFIALGDADINGGDLGSTSSTFNLLNGNVTTLNFAGAATTLNIADVAITSTIDIGGVSTDGTTTVNIATNGTANADAINIGNTNVGTIVNLTGGNDWSINGSSGLITTAGNAAINGGGISATAALAISSSGGDISLGPNGSGLAYITVSDDFAVGAATLVAPFSVDESLNTVRIGDGANDTNDPSIVFYASDGADSGTFNYDDADVFKFSGGNISHAALGTYPTTADADHNSLESITTISGTSNASLNTIGLYSVSGSMAYAGLENATGTDHYVSGVYGLTSLTGATTTLSRAYAVSGELNNSATNATMIQAGGYLAAVDGAMAQKGAQTISNGYGVHGSVTGSAGTITDAIGVFGEVTSSVGTLTRGYGGRMSNTAAGTTRFGVFAEASGGTANYAGYFTGSWLQVDADATPDTPAIVDGAGDLYIGDELEALGNVAFGDTTGTDAFTFTSAATTTNGTFMAYDSLTSGHGLSVRRADGATDFDGYLVQILQGNNNGTSDGEALYVENNSTSTTSAALYITQAQTSNQTDAAGGTAVGAQALILDITEAASTDDAMMIRAAGAIKLVMQTDGQVLSDGAYSSAGADYAEYFATVDTTLADSEVICQDTATSNAVKRCEAGNTDVVGIVSPNPGFIGNLPNTSDVAPNLVIVGLTGQIDTYATAVEGAIAIGDAVTTSQTVSGYAAKAHGPDRIIGFALEALPAGTGLIKVYVNPQWYGGDVLSSDGSAIVASANIISASLGTANAATSYDSGDLMLRGSGWNGTSAVAKDMMLRTSVADAGAAYRLSVMNDDGAEVAYVGESGDLAIAGKFYPSDRGTLQTSKYIYYDGSSGAGGDVMRTNAGGWGTGSYDFAEMFPSRDVLAAGEIVTFASGKEEVQRSTGIAYDDKIAGIISTRPGFVAGNNEPGHVAVALAGRVPTYVSGENGAIAIGDPLTTSTKRGYAMRATEAGPIVGYAMEAFNGTTGVVIAFVRPSYYDGINEAPAADNTASQITSISQLDVSGGMDLAGGSINAVASIIGIGGNWRISENGDVLTHGRITSFIRGYDGQEVETVAALGRETTVQLSGTATLHNGNAHIDFADVDPSFSQIIANNVPYRVMVTPYGATEQLYVAERTQQGFVIRETGSTNGVLVDWLVIAYHKDFAPELVVEDVLAPAPVEAPNDSPINGVGGEVIPVVETPEIIIDEPIAEETIVEVIAEPLLGTEFPADGLAIGEPEAILVEPVIDAAPVVDEPVVDEPATL